MSTLDLMELRRALGAFVTGVTVVTTLDTEGTPRGFTANSFTSVSLDPPLVLVCIGKSGASFNAFRNAKGYAVNILAEAQRDVSGVFAGPSEDRFAHVDWTPGPAGNPLLAGTAAWLDCTMHEQVDAGDHAILIGRVVGFESNSNSEHAQPLGYCRGAYVTFGIDAETLGARATRVGAIIEREAAVLLLTDDDGQSTLPTASDLGPKGNPASLRARLAKLGIDVDPSLLFAVFEDRENEHLSVFYRITYAGDTPHDPSATFVPFDEIDVATLASPADRDMLSRYIRERTTESFGIYVGDQHDGVVHTPAEQSRSTTGEREK
ncbi:MAG: flavin reductase family protein [Pseudomonadota bacterium]